MDVGDKVQCLTFIMGPFLFTFNFKRDFFLLNFCSNFVVTYTTLKANGNLFFFSLFVEGVYVPLENIFTQMETSTLLVKVFKFLTHTWDSCPFNSNGS